MRWSYGITTCPARKDTLLPQTIVSLARSGFDKPRIHVDGARDGFDHFGLDVTYHWPSLNPNGASTFPNWVLALWEQYVRDPKGDRYAIFQDDLIACKNLREYLEKSPYPKLGYCNLYTFPENENLASNVGWFPSNQCGLGAVALVFSREAVRVLLSSAELAIHPQTVRNNLTRVDGVVVDSMKNAGWKEYCHMPSLVQHSGQFSVLRNRDRADTWRSRSFPGQEYNLLELL